MSNFKEEVITLLNYTISKIPKVTDLDSLAKNLRAKEEATDIFPSKFIIILEKHFGDGAISNQHKLEIDELLTLSINKIMSA